MRQQLKQSIKVLRRSSREDVVPREVMFHAKGIVLLTQIKGSWFFSGALAAGIFMSVEGTDEKGEKKWSNPVSIIMAGAGVGFQFGGQKADIIIILNDKSSVRAFQSHGSLRLGAQYGLAAGPLGRDLQANVGVGGSGFSGMFSYSMSQGLYIGISLEGNIVFTRSTDNYGFYRTRSARLRNIINGDIQPPTGPKADSIKAMHIVLNNLCYGRRFDFGLGSIDMGSSLEDNDAPIGSDGEDEQDWKQQRAEEAALAQAAKEAGNPMPPGPGGDTHDEALADHGKELLTGALDANGKMKTVQSPGWGGEGDLLGLEDNYSSPPPPIDPNAAHQPAATAFANSAPEAVKAPTSYPAPMFAVSKSYSSNEEGGETSATQLAFDKSRLVVEKDHPVNEDAPEMKMHNIIAVSRGDPLFLLDGDLEFGLPAPYTDYVSVQRLSDGKTGKVSKYCLAYAVK